MTTSSVNPQNLSYLNRQPYITTTEFKRSPIGATVDITNLVPDGGYAAQEAALSELIAMASAEADNYCLGPFGTLCATSNTEQGRYRPNRQGMYVIHPAFFPILEVDSFAVGTLPAGQTSVTVSSQNCWIEDRQFVMATGPITTTSNGPLDFGGFMQTNQQQFVTYSYVNGWFNQFLSTSIATGATSITVPSGLGLYAGSNFTIWDGATTENVTVASTYTGGTTIPLVSGVLHAHSAGVNVSTLPASVKQAIIHLTVAAIKQRGEGGLVIAETGEPVSVGKGDTSGDDLMRAEELLHAFIQVWGRA